MIQLPEITLVCVDCVHYNSAVKAIKKSIEKISFGRVLLLTDIVIESDFFETVMIEKITSKEAYSEFMMKKLSAHIDTNFVLIIQYDGYIINPDLWNLDWLQYDYIGAPWWYEYLNVGNGGFSLRSKKLLQACCDTNVVALHPEDDRICRKYRKYLEQKYKIKYAPEDVAVKFSIEPNGKYPYFNNNTFGFHGISNFIL